VPTGARCHAAKADTVCDTVERYACQHAYRAGVLREACHPASRTRRDELTATSWTRVRELRALTVYLCSMILERYPERRVSFCRDHRVGIVRLVHAPGFDLRRRRESPTHPPSLYLASLSLSLSLPLPPCLPPSFFLLCLALCRGLCAIPSPWSVGNSLKEHLRKEIRCAAKKLLILLTGLFWPWCHSPAAHHCQRPPIPIQIGVETCSFRVFLRRPNVSRLLRLAAKTERRDLSSK